LDEPLNLADGTEVEIQVFESGQMKREEDETVKEFGLRRLGEELDHPDDSIYDDWKKLYGV
jgi:hypothetical protein